MFMRTWRAAAIIWKTGSFLPVLFYSSSFFSFTFLYSQI